MGQSLELGTRQCFNQVFGHTAYRHDIRQVDFRRRGAGKFDFGLFGSFLQALHGHGVGREVGTFVVLELLNEPVDDHVVEVVTAEVRIAVGRKHFKHAAAEFQDGNIKRTAAEVKHGNLHVLVGLVDTVGEGRSRRFVHDALHVKTCNLSGFFCSLTL